MTERIGRNFLTGEAAAIATYDYTDLAEGTGIKTFYAGDMNLSGAVVYGLFTEPFTTPVGETTAISSIHFDLTPFNLPKTVANGIAYFGCMIRGGASGGENIKLVIQLEKSGADAITAITGKEYTQQAGQGEIKRALVPLKCTQTHFKKGDILRMTVTPVRSGTTWFSHAPDGRDTEHFTSAGGAFDTTMKISIPFKIDL